MVTRAIAIDCLKCGHRVTMPGSELVGLGFKEDGVLGQGDQKLVCSRCRSKAVSAYRYIDDDLDPQFPLVP